MVAPFHCPKFSLRQANSCVAPDGVLCAIVRTDHGEGSRRRPSACAQAHSSARVFSRHCALPTAIIWPLTSHELITEMPPHPDEFHQEPADAVPLERDSGDKITLHAKIAFVES